MNKKKIAVFMDYLPGRKTGGPLKRIINMVDALGDEFNIYIISRDHDFGENKRFPDIHTGWNIIGKAKVLYLSDHEITRKRYGEILDETEADMVYTMTVFSVKLIFPCISAAKKRKIPVLIAPCGQTCANSLRLKSWKKLPYLKIMKTINAFSGIYFHTTSDEEYQSMITYLGIETKYLCNIPNIPQRKNKTAKKHKTAGKIRILYVSRIHRKKNLLYAIKIIKQVRCNVNFDIYGPLEDLEYWEQCKKEIEHLPTNVNIQYIKALSPIEAENIYQNYDCFFFPTLSENYGFAIAESLLADCPVLLSKGTTPWDDYANYADLVYDLNDHEGFISAIEKIAAMENMEYLILIQKTREYVNYKINYSKILKQHKMLFYNIINNKNINLL